MEIVQDASYQHIIKELYTNPDLGFLGAENFFRLFGLGSATEHIPARGHLKLPAID